jgi:hypothetical protein
MPPEASSNIDYATGTSPAADTRQDIWSLTPEQATEILEQRALDFRPRAPTSPENSRDAALRLEELSKDVGWYRKLTSGSMEARAEFERLTALKNAAPTEAMPGEQIFDVTTGEGGSGSLTRSQLIGIAEDMRREGVFNEKGIEFILSDQKFEPDAVHAAQVWLERMERDSSVLYPDLPPDRERQMKFMRTIATIGTGDTP